MKTITIEITKEQYTYLMQTALILHITIDELLQSLIDSQIAFSDTDTKEDLWE